MKILIDTKTGAVKINGKLLKDAPEHHKQIAEYSLRLAYQDNYPLSDYEEDSMWMSWRYCIGRHTIAAHMRAGDIWKHCKGRMDNDRQLFNAFDINNEIEQKMKFWRGPKWHFPITSSQKIYTTAIDIFCEFLEDFNIKSKEDYLKYYKIDVILADNERGYKIETTTWEEYLIPLLVPIFKDYDLNKPISGDKAWELFNKWKNGDEELKANFDWIINPIVKDMPNPEHFYFNDIEDLFVWNDLAHCFDIEHHHKSILMDGTECEWFWTWIEKSEQHDDGYLYKTFGYERIRCPLNEWNGNIITWIPAGNIKKDIY